MTTIPNVIYLFPKNTQVIEIDGLQDAVTGNFLNTATATATLFDINGDADPILNAIPMTYVPSSNGIYQGIVPDTFNAALGKYTLVITATQGSVQALWSIPAQVRVRTS